MQSSLHADSSSYQPPALPPMTDYLATSLSLDTRVPAFCDSIDRLSGCLERVVAKVADCSILSQMSSSRHHSSEKTEESTLHSKCALRTVPACSSSFLSLSVPAALVPHANPPPCNLSGLAGVTNRYAPAGPPTDFAGVPGAVQSVAVPTIIPPFPAIPLPLPPHAISALQLPVLVAQAQTAQIFPAHLSELRRSEPTGGAMPFTSSSSIGYKLSGFPPCGPPDDPDDGDPDKRKRKKDINEKCKDEFLIDSAFLCCLGTLQWLHEVRSRAVRARHGPHHQGLYRPDGNENGRRRRVNGRDEE